MIRTEIAPHELLEHGLDIEKCPPDVRAALKSFRPELELVYNVDQEQWELYKWICDGKKLYHQMTILRSNLITPGIIDRIKRYNLTEGGKLDSEDIQNKWFNAFKECQEKKKAAKEKEKEDLEKYYYKDAQRALTRALMGSRHIVVPHAVVGVNKKTGKKIRAYK